MSANGDITDMLVSLCACHATSNHYTIWPPAQLKSPSFVAVRQAARPSFEKAEPTERGGSCSGL